MIRGRSTLRAAVPQARPAGEPKKRLIPWFVTGALQGNAQVTITGGGESGGYEGFLDRKDAERALAPDLPVRIEYEGRNGPGTLSLDVLDRDDLGRRADLLISEGIGTPADRHDLISRLSRAKPGSTVVLCYEHPDADDAPTPPLPYVESERPPVYEDDDEDDLFHESDLAAVETP